jgi:hypothetical protein
MISSTSPYEQKEHTKTLKHQRSSVSFSDDVTTHEIPKLDADERAEVYFSRSDYKKFLIAQQIRVDRHKAKLMRRMIEDVSATLEAHTLELVELQTPVDLLLVQPVRQTSPSRMNVSDVSAFEAAVSEPPCMPVRMPVRRVSHSRITVTDFSTTPVTLSEPPIITDTRTANVKVSEPPTTLMCAKPVWQDANMKANDMAIVQVAFPTSPRSRLDGALAA